MGFDRAISGRPGARSKLPMIRIKAAGMAPSVDPKPGLEAEIVTLRAKLAEAWLRGDRLAKKVNALQDELAALRRKAVVPSIPDPATAPPARRPSMIRLRNMLLAVAEAHGVDPVAVSGKGARLGPVSDARTEFIARAREAGFSPTQILDIMPGRSVSSIYKTLQNHRVAVTGVPS